MQQPQGIISILKDIAASFAKMEADTMAQEETDQKAFDEEKKSCEIEKARRSKESEMKEEEKKRLLEKIDAMEKSEKHVEEELGAVVQYLSDLSPACVEGDSTYEDRKASRSNEISALKQAQVLLRELAVLEEWCQGDGVVDTASAALSALPFWSRVGEFERLSAEDARGHALELLPSSSQRSREQVVADLWRRDPRRRAVGRCSTMEWGA